MENLEPTLATLGARWDNAPRMGRHSIAKWHFNIPHSFKFIIANLPTGMFLANEKKQMNLEERIGPGNLELWSSNWIGVVTPLRQKLLNRNVITKRIISHVILFPSKNKES